MNQEQTQTSQYKLDGQDLNNPVEDQENDDNLEFTNFCNECGEMGINKMCKITIPFVRDLIIMTFICDHCGNKDTEVKGANGITPQGKMFILNVASVADLQRDVFKSETASLRIPELDLEMCTGTLGGVFTNIQGLLVKILDHLKDKTPIYSSVDDYYSKKLQDIFDKIEAFENGDEKFTLIIRDLIDSSFVSSIGEPNQDLNLQIIEFDRTEEDDDELGIDTMNTENYL